MIIKICFGRRDEFWAIGSRLIRHVEKTDFSHAWIEIDKYVYESVFPVSHAIKKDKHHYTVTNEFAFELPDDKRSDALNFIYKLLGKRYSSVQLLAIYLGKMSPIADKYLSKHNITGKHELICVELCARFLNHFFKIDFSESFDMVCLNDLYDKSYKYSFANGGYK